METIGDITVEHPVPQSVIVYIKQDDDVIVVYKDEIVGLADALREYSPLTSEEPKPAPEKWYVVLKNSNFRLPAHAIPGATSIPLIFTIYSDARIYASNFGGLERTFVPISVDEYERAFGR